MQDKRAIVLATRNQGKVVELRELMAGFGETILDMTAFPDVPDVDETETTLEGNARRKARLICSATGLIAVADDSGLEVDYLGGAPGVYSARYSSEPGLPATDAGNMAKVLRKLKGVPWEQRTCRFRVVLAVYAPHGQQAIFSGVWEGYVAEEPKGDQGFGYDPIFFDPELGRHAAEFSGEEKNRVSHRGKALRALLTAWPEFKAGLK
jgi:XTP/dITP diphosphohydrolase